MSYGLILILIGKLLNPDFEIATEAGNQVFRQELAIALTKTPSATPLTRKRFKAEAEHLARKVFLKGQKIFHLSPQKMVIYWDSLSPSEVARTVYVDGRNVAEFKVHLNEITFFAHREDYLKAVIPHEVAHLIHYQIWNRPDGHDEDFLGIVRKLVPNYQRKEFDLTAACRLSARLLAANNAVGSDQGCE